MRGDLYYEKRIERLKAIGTTGLASMGFGTFIALINDPGTFGFILGVLFLVFGFTDHCLAFGFEQSTFKEYRAFCKLADDEPEASE